MDFSTIADSATSTLNTALDGTAPAVIGICALVAAVGLVIKLLRKAAR